MPDSVRAVPGVHAEREGNASEADPVRFDAALANRDELLVMMAGLAHSGGLGLDRHRVWHVTHAFLTYPPMRTA